MAPNCQLFESQQQAIVLQLNKKVTKHSLLIPHDSWFLAIAKEALIPREERVYISPVSYLYVQYKKDLLKNTLYAFVSENNLYLITFNDEVPRFLTISPLVLEEDIIPSIERFLKEFYQQEGSYFIEKLFLYKHIDAPFSLDPKEVEERLFLDVELIVVSQEDICKTEGIERFAIQQQKSETKEKTNYALFIFFFILLLGLVGIDYYIRHTTKQYKEEIAQLIQKQVTIANKTNHYSQKIIQQEKIGPLLATIQDKNEKVIHTIWTVFDLIDDETLLKRAYFDKEQTVLEGFTTNKDSLELLRKRLEQIYSKVLVESSEVQDGYEFVIKASQEVA